MHLLQQHTFDIRCSSEVFGKEIQGQLRDLLEKEFYPKLDILLDRYTHPNHIWNIDLMELQLPKIDKEDWKTELVQKSLQQIEAYLKDNSPAIQAQYNNESVTAEHFIPNEKHAGFLFFNFLKTGVLPENAMGKDLDRIVAKIDITPVFLKKLMVSFETDPVCITRWIFAVPDFFKEKVMARLDDFPVAVSRFLQTVFSNENNSETRQLRRKFQGNKILKLQWMELVQWFGYLHQKGIFGGSVFKEFTKLSEKYWEVSVAESAVFFEGIAQILKAENQQTGNEAANFFQVFSQNASAGDFPKPLREISNPDASKEEQPVALQYINNAGLILLHPFLKTLFERLGLCENEVWKKEMDQHKAILLTQYMVTGGEEIQENDLVLNKILCGFPVENAVNIKLKITKKEKETCHGLLEAVLEHWKVMSGSSKEALQQTFLQREGKLDIQMGNSFELWVEEKGYDVLLAQLPWGIGMVRTPWMENYLTCHWN